MIRRGNLVKSKNANEAGFDVGLVVSQIYPTLVVRSGPNSVSESHEVLVVDVLSKGQIYTNILIDSIEILEA